MGRGEYREVDETTLKNIIESSSLRFRSGPQSYIFDCPKCNKPLKLYVRKRDGKFRCMRCGPDFSGWADEVLSVLLSQPIQAIRELLYDHTSTPGTQAFSVEFEDHWDEFFSDEEFIEGEAQLPDLLWSPDVFELTSPASVKGVEYLQRRGVDLELALQYGLKFNPAEQRVVFPVEQDGRLLGWQARYIKETSFYNEEKGEMISIPKMLTVGAIGGKALMFYDRLRGASHAVLTEGPFDAIACHLCGGNVATMGKGVTKQQLDLILKRGIRKIYVGLDPDASEDISRILRELSDNQVECLRLDPPKGYEDLGAAPREAVLESFKTAPKVNAGHMFIYFS